MRHFILTCGTTFLEEVQHVLLLPYEVLWFLLDEHGPGFLGYWAVSRTIAAIGCAIVYATPVGLLSVAEFIRRIPRRTRSG